MSQYFKEGPKTQLNTTQITYNTKKHKSTEIKHLLPPTLQHLNKTTEGRSQAEVNLVHDMKLKGL